MNNIKQLICFLGLTSYLSIAGALPILSHTVDDSGLYTVTVDGSNDPLFVALDVHGINGAALGDDLGTNFGGTFSIIDENSDGMLEFTFSSSDSNLTELTGVAAYSNEGRESFSYALTNEAVDLPTSPPATPTPASPIPSSPAPSSPTSSVPEPTTFLLLGFGLLGIAGSRLFRNKSL